MTTKEYEIIHNWLQKTRIIIRRTANEMIMDNKIEQAAQANLTAEAMTTAISILNTQAIANGIHTYL